MKDLRETACILRMKIYRDRFKRLLRLFQSTYIDTILENFRKDYLPIGQKIFLSKGDCPITPQERERMSRVPYASIVDSIIYVMTCTRPDVAYS